MTNLLRTSLFVPIVLLSVTAARAQSPSYSVVTAPLSIEQKTAVPGHLLEPGQYSLHIVDHLKDRFILQVEDTSGKRLSTFIGLHNPDFDAFDTLKHQGPIFWTAAPKGEKAIRGFSFPNGKTLELVYPKGEAVALAKLNTSSVPAIDPESEGRKPDPKLSPEDREVVTLWMLTATRVGPKNDIPAIAAKRFVATSEEPGSAPVQTAATALPPEYSRTVYSPAPPPLPAARELCRLPRQTPPKPPASTLRSGSCPRPPVNFPSSFCSRSCCSLSRPSSASRAPGYE